MIFVEFSGREILDSNPKCWVTKKIQELGENWVLIPKIYVNYEGQIYGFLENPEPSITKQEPEIMEAEIDMGLCEENESTDEICENPIQDDLQDVSIERDFTAQQDSDIYKMSTDEVSENQFQQNIKDEFSDADFIDGQDSDVYEVSEDDEIFRPTTNQSRSSFYEKFIDPKTEKLMCKCNTCGKITNIGLMNQHVQSHLEGCQLCKYCGQVFETRYKLNSHENSHKKSEAQTFPHDPGLYFDEKDIIHKDLTCLHCESTTLVDLPKSVHNKTSQNCLKTCKRRFIDRYNLRRHKCEDQNIEVHFELEDSEIPQKLIHKMWECSICNESNCIRFTAYIKGIPPEKFKSVKPRRPRSSMNLRELTKSKRISGESYVNSFGKLRPARKMGAPCEDNCKYKCKINISEEERQGIFDQYWKLDSDFTKRQFVAKCMETAERKYVRVGAKVTRSENNCFYFQISPEKKIRVCKKYFVRTLGIGEGSVKTIRQMVKKFGEVIDYERRGRHMNKIRIEESIQNDIRNYISANLKIHNDEERSNKAQEFIDCGGTLAAFHREYVVQCDNEKKEFGSYSKFKQIFYEEFISNNKVFEQCFME